MSKAVIIFWRDDRGSTAIEYGLIVGLVFLAIVGALTTYSSSTGDMYGRMSSAVNGVISP